MNGTENKCISMAKASKPCVNVLGTCGIKMKNKRPGYDHKENKRCKNRY